MKEFKLPDVGEGLTEADIVPWHVKPGDAVEVNQIIVEIETAKAVVELPCPWDGVVVRLLAEEGQTVDVGVPIIAVDTWRAGDVPDRRRPAPTCRAAAAGRERRPGRRTRPERSRSWSATASSRRRHTRRPRRTAGAARPATAEPSPTAPEVPVRAPALATEPRPPSHGRRAAGRRGPRAGRRPGQAAGAQAGQGPGRGPDHAGRHRPARLDHPGRRPAAAAADTAARSAIRRSRTATAPTVRPGGRSASRSGACASTPPRPWCRARSPRRTSPSSSRST